MKESFLAALQENEDDLTTRLVYADWLDENGEHEEAERQRQWTPAKEWLMEFCRQNNPSPDDEDPYEYPISYDELIEQGRQAVAEGRNGELWISCGNNESMCDALRSHSDEFWKHWSIVTGIDLPEGPRGAYSCAC
ncbi:MAG: TIGR02996 domain-containing protein [Planctomycetaceae bacterium]